MKAILYSQYGAPEVLRLKEIEKPSPKKNEVLIKIHATAVSSGDVRLRKADPFAVRFFFGLFKPKKKNLGFVLAGEIESVGSDVTLFRKSDEIFGTTGMRFGAYAEYISLPEKAVLAIKPATINWEEAAAIPFGGNTALYFLRKANITSGQKVLVYGASGALGTAAVQLAKYFDTDVTGVCSTANVELVRSLGADTVIDYTREDFTKNKIQYDLIFDTVGKASFSRSIRSLKKNGTLVLSAAGLSEMIRGAWVSMTSSKKVVSGVMRETQEDMNFFKQLIEKGKFRSVIDRIYPLEKIADAHRYVESGHKIGNVVISIEH